MFWEYRIHHPVLGKQSLPMKHTIENDSAILYEGKTERICLRYGCVEEVGWTPPC